MYIQIPAFIWPNKVDFFLVLGGSLSSLCIDLGIQEAFLGLTRIPPLSVSFGSFFFFRAVSLKRLAQPARTFASH